MMAKETVEGIDVVAKNIIAFGKEFLTEVNRDMEKIRKIVVNKLTENVSLTDHSLSDLARLGHPYSRARGRPLHSPNYKVHTQSGKLLGGVYSQVEKAQIRGGILTATAIVGIRDSVGHAIHVIMGTSRMIPRDFIIGSAQEKKEESLDILKRGLKGTVINFAGKQVRL